MTVSIDGEIIKDPIVFKCHPDYPKTSQNFIDLCSAKYSGRSYAGSFFHRIDDTFMCQGGDIDGLGELSGVEYIQTGAKYAYVASDNDIFITFNAEKDRNALVPQLFKKNDSAWYVLSLILFR